MWSVVASALAARRGQTIIVAVVALLAGGAIAAAPWYAAAAVHDVTTDAVSGAPVADRMIVASRRLGADDPVPADPASEIRRIFDPSGFASVTGAHVSVRLEIGTAAAGEDAEDAEDGEAAENGEDDPAQVTLTQREHVCSYLEVAGSCPAAGDELMIPAGLGEQLGLPVGGEIELAQGGEVVRSFRIVGHYEIVDPSDLYWGTGELVGAASTSRGTERASVFTTLDGLQDLQRVAYTYELLLEPATLTTMEIAEFETMVADGVAALRANDYAVNRLGVSALLERLPADQRNAVLGIGVGVAVLLLLSWFTLAVVLRGAANQLRGDLGWWRLHGVPSARGWLAALGQSVAPLLAGAAVGAVAGAGMGRAVGGVPQTAAADQQALWQMLVLVGLVVVGGLVAVVATQAGTLRTPVRDLLRRVPARTGRWRRSVVDLLVILLAAGAVGQAMVAGREAEGVALLAAPLGVLALALVAAWAVPPLVALLAGRALHRGRVGVALVAASMARRTGTHRLFALVAVAVALVTAGFVGWDTDARTQWQRAALEVGAERVITVRTTDAAELLAAVRAVDPAGTEAMAVIHRPSPGPHPSVLALDTTRLGLVAGWREEYGGEVDDIAAALRPAAPAPVELTGQRLELEAAGSDPAGGPVHLRVRLRALDTGAPVDVVVGPLTAQPDTYQAAVPQCAAVGCRLVGVALLGQPESAGSYPPAAPGTEVALRRLADAPVTDLARWRPAVGPRDLGLSVGVDGGGLTLAVPDPLPTEVSTPWSAGFGLEHQLWAFVLDAPLPLPALATGWRASPTQEVRLAPLIGSGVPAELVGEASLLPIYAGSGVVVDLEYAERLVPFARAGGVAQVWLSATAPPSIVDDLRELGVVPVREESLAGEVARLSSEGSAVAVRFQTMVALVALLLAAGAVLASATQERSGRAAELAALRAQGVSSRIVRTVGYGSVAMVAAPAAAVGLVAGLAGAAIAQVLHPGFIDGWELMPLAPLRGHPVGGAAVATVLVLGAAVLPAAAALIRRTRLQGRSA